MTRAPPRFDRHHWRTVSLVLLLRDKQGAMRFITSLAVLLVFATACRRDHVEPVDYRDAIIGTYTCERYWTSYWGSSSSYGTDTQTVVVTKDPNSATQIVIDISPAISNCEGIFPLGTDYKYSATGGSSSQLREIRFHIDTPLDSIYLYHHYYSPGTGSSERFNGIK